MMQGSIDTPTGVCRLEGMVRCVRDEEAELLREFTCEFTWESDAENEADATAEVKEESAVGRLRSGAIVLSIVSQLSGLKLRSRSPSPSTWPLLKVQLSAGILSALRVFCNLCSSPLERLLCSFARKSVEFTRADLCRVCGNLRRRRLLPSDSVS